MTARGLGSWGNSPQLIINAFFHYSPALLIAGAIDLILWLHSWLQLRNSTWRTNCVHNRPTASTPWLHSGN